MDIHGSVHLAKLAIRQGNIGLAQSTLKQVIQRDPNNAEAWMTLASVVKNLDQVRDCLERVLEIDPQNEMARNQLMRLLQPKVSPFTEIPLERIEVDISNDEIEPLGDDLDWLNKPFERTIQPDRTKKTEPYIRFEEKPEPEKKPNYWFEVLLSILVIVVIGVIAVLLIGVENVPFLSGLLNPPEEDFRAVIYENIAAANDEDLNRYMATIHPFSPIFFKTRNSVRGMFNNSDLSFRVSGIRIHRKTKNEIVVYFSLILREVRGGSSVDNQSTGKMTLKKFLGSWKIYDQEVYEITRLR